MNLCYVYFIKKLFLFVEMKLLFYQREASLILAKGAQAGLNTSNYLWIVTQVIVFSLLFSLLLLFLLLLLLLLLLALFITVLKIAERGGRPN